MNFIHHTAVIGPNVIIEDDVYVGPFCIIGEPAEWKGREGEQRGVVIGAGSRLTGHVTVDSGVERKTLIGAGCYLMKHSHVGHDAVLGSDVTVSCGAKVGGHTVIGEGCNIGLNAVIHQKMIIAPGCMIGMGSVVTKKLDTQPFCVYIGNPAKFLYPNEKHPNYPRSQSREFINIDTSSNV